MLKFLATPEAITRGSRATIKRATEMLDGVASQPVPTFDNTIKPFATVENELATAINTLPYYQYVSADKEMRTTAEQIAEELSQFRNEANKRKDVFEKVKAFHKTGDLDSLQPQDRRYVDKVYSDLKRIGLDLSAGELAKLAALENELSSLEIKYQSNLSKNSSYLEFTREELAGVSDSLLQQFDHENGLYKVSFKITDYTVVMKFCTVEQTRKKMFVGYENLCPENDQIFLRALELRRQIASILGYKTYAHYALDDKMAQTPETVEKFLSDLLEKTRSAAAAEKAEMLRIKQELVPGATQVYAWDSSFLQNKVVERDFKVNHEAISEYFETEHTVGQAFKIFEQLFGIKFEKVNLQPDETWHEEVEGYAISQDGKLAGWLYLDSYPRPNKYGHFANFPLRMAYKDENKYNLSASSLVCNFPRARENTPALLYHNDVVTFFHELGHGLHSTLGLSDYFRFSGTCVQRDFVEAPSQLLENWAWDKKVLKMISKHYKTGKPMSDELIDQLAKSRLANQATFLVRQLFFAVFDFKGHTNPEFDVAKEWMALRNEIIGLQSPESLAGYNQFAHLMGGYEAGYYSYLWAEVFSADLWETLFAADPFSKQAGYKYRDELLSKGYIYEGGELLERVLGRPPSIEPFLRSRGLIESKY